MNITLYDIALRYVGVKEVAGHLDNPVIMSMLKLDGEWPQHDEVPWCSGAMNWWAWHLRLPRSKSLLARSWLEVGTPIELEDATPGWDVVIYKRGGGRQPGPENTTAPGHVGLYGGMQGSGKVWTLGGNQSDQVKLSLYPKSRLLGVRRLYHG